MCLYRSSTTWPCRDATFILATSMDEPDNETNARCSFRRERPNQMRHPDPSTRSSPDRPVRFNLLVRDRVLVLYSRTKSEGPFAFHLHCFHLFHIINIIFATHYHDMLNPKMLSDTSWHTDYCIAADTPGQILDAALSRSQAKATSLRSESGINQNTTALVWNAVTSLGINLADTKTDITTSAADTESSTLRLFSQDAGKDPNNASWPHCSAAGVQSCAFARFAAENDTAELHSCAAVLDTYFDR